MCSVDIGVLKPQVSEDRHLKHIDINTSYQWNWYLTYSSYVLYWGIPVSVLIATIFFRTDVAASKGTLSCKLKIQQSYPPPPPKKKKKIGWSRSRHFMLVPSSQPVTWGSFPVSLVFGMATCGTPRQNSLYSKICFIHHLRGKGVAGCRSFPDIRMLILRAVIA